LENACQLEEEGVDLILHSLKAKTLADSTVAIKLVSKKWLKNQSQSGMNSSWFNAGLG